MRFRHFLSHMRMVCLATSSSMVYSSCSRANSSSTCRLLRMSHRDTHTHTHTHTQTHTHTLPCQTETHTHTQMTSLSLSLSLCLSLSLSLSLSHRSQESH